ncbi:MAG: glycerol-3-phosphate dehydrogenase, partial [Rubrivivax sp.]
MKISVLGAGAWGTALAIQAARAGHDVRLWGRDAEAVAQMRARRRNADYLPDSELPEHLGLTADRAEAVAHAADGLTIIATPMSGLRETLAALPVTQ